MQQRLARFMAPWLVAQLLIASVGLPLHILRCYCDGSSEISLWVEAHECEAKHSQGKMLACCSKPAQPVSCHQPAPSAGADQLALQSSCGDVEQAFVQLQVEYSPLDSKSTPPAAAIVAPQPPAFAALSSWPVLQQEPYRLAFRYPPPPPSGQALRVQVQSFLC